MSPVLCHFPVSKKLLKKESAMQQMQYTLLKINYDNKNHFGYGNTAKFKNADTCESEVHGNEHFEVSENTNWYRF